jgi:uncharacterized protein (TIGR04255 family)
MPRYPTRLARSPLVEAVFEMRFAQVAGRSVELLLGQLYQRLGHDFSSIEPLPIGGLPKELRESRPELKYAPHVKFAGKGQTVMFGDRVLTLSITTPYPGWARFSERCVQVASALHETGYVGKLERYSLKYVNVIDTTDSAFPFEALNVKLDAAGYNLRSQGLQLRFEIDEGPFVSVVECTSADGVIADRQIHNGWLLVLDTICERNVPSDFWSKVGENVAAAHDVLKPLFYGMLAARTVEALGPSFD